MSRQFIIFALVGGFAAGVNWGSRYLLSVALTLEAAIIIAYIIGMTVAYFLNRWFVFGQSGRSIRDEYTRFGIVNLVALVQVFLVTIGLDRYLFPAIGLDWHKTEIAHAIGVASPILTSFIGHKYFTFRDDSGTPKS